MAENSVEERMLELIEEICDDEIIREERCRSVRGGAARLYGRH